MTLHMSHNLEPLGSNQDYIVTGSVDEFDYLIIIDGHGEGDCLNILKQLDWSIILLKLTSKEILAEINKNILIQGSSLVGDGATISIVKLYPEKIKVFWLGDSQVHVVVDGIYYTTTNHNTKNREECNRESNIITMKNTFKVVSETTCTVVPNQYFILSNNDILAVSRSLGHDFVTYQQFEELDITLKTDSCFRILAASDGLYDMLYEEQPLNVYPDYNAEDYTNLAKRRWKQIWEIQYGDSGGHVFHQSFENDMDDVAVVVCKKNC